MSEKLDSNVVVVNLANIKFCNTRLTSDIEIVKVRQSYCALDLPSVQILKRAKRLESKFLGTVLTTQSGDTV